VSSMGDGSRAKYGRATVVSWSLTLWIPRDASTCSDPAQLDPHSSKSHIAAGLCERAAREQTLGA
jgi:hypothetical protein